jgi:excisionase family DNA binding protein
VIEPHYTTAQLCELLNLHEETVRKYASTGALKSVRFGNVRRYARSAVEAFLKACEDSGPSDKRRAARVSATVALVHGRCSSPDSRR